VGLPTQVIRYYEVDQVGCSLRVDTPQDIMLS